MKLIGHDEQAPESVEQGAVTSTPSGKPSARDSRDAALASVLAEAVRTNKLDAVDALRVIRHEMRRRNTNKKLLIPVRSTEANEVILKYLALGTPPPKNGSPEALHADHVFPISAEDLHAIHEPSEWLTRLKDLRQVVCVTARENYLLEKSELKGASGWAKYETAGIEWTQALA